MLTAGLDFGSEDTRFGKPDFKPHKYQQKALTDFQRKEIVNRDPTLKFMIYAGVGSGKTHLSAMIAADLLRRRVVERVVFICNNRSIKSSAKSTFAEWGIHLADYNTKKHAFHGEGGMYNGIILTYQSLATNPHPHHAAAQLRKSLVIFDEIHHLGEDQTWSEAAEFAFGSGLVPVVVGLTGTPMRTDFKQIAFARYKLVEGGLYQLECDVNFSLGKAVGARLCRRPLFRMVNATMEVKRKDGSLSTISFGDTGLTKDDADLLLREFVKPGSHARRLMLQEAVEFCLANGIDPLKMLIFVDRVDDAEIYIRDELLEMGVDLPAILPISSDSKDAVAKIAGFGSGDAWIMPNVNMVSEGTNIPEVRVVVILSNCLSIPLFIQRIGRAVRGQGFCFIYAPAHPVIVGTCVDVEDDVIRNVALAESEERAERDPADKGRGPVKSTDYNIAGFMDGFVSGGQVSSEGVYLKARRFCRERGMDLTHDLATVVNLIRQGLLHFDDPKGAA